MKKLMTVLVMIISIVFVSSCGSDNITTTAKERPKKILIAYYSQNNRNTATVAKEIQKITGGDIFQIKTTTEYPKNVPGFLAQVKSEYTRQIRPELAEQLPNFDEYDLVFLGFPNWYDSPPMGVFTFLEQYKWEGKTIAPFITYGLSGMGSSIGDIHTSAPQATILRGLAIHASEIKGSNKLIEDWLKQINLK